jgi:hypothetical protein
MALPVFPDQNLSNFIRSFTEQLDEDFQSPSVSKFQDYMPRCRAGLQSMEEVQISLGEEKGEEGKRGGEGGGGKEGRRRGRDT